MKALLAHVLLGLLLMAPALAQPVTVLVAYDSVDGHTEQVAGWIAEGAGEDKQAEVRLKRVGAISLDDLLWADAILVGSPVYNAGLTPPVGKFIAEWPFDGAPLKNKVGAAFSSAEGASAGEELVLMDILHSMMLMQMVIVGGDDWRSAFGVSLIQDITSDPKVLGYTRDKARRLGRRAVTLARCTEPMRAALPPYVPKPKKP
jgi:NAD(P)H dehydrogenase (quinone)